MAVGRRALLCGDEHSLEWVAAGGISVHARGGTCTLVGEGACRERLA